MNHRRSILMTVGISKARPRLQTIITAAIALMARTQATIRPMVIFMMLGFLTVLPTVVKSATFTAASTSIGAVSNAMDLCSPGDTVQIPSGSASWTNGLKITNAIHIVGNGRGNTIIYNAIDNSTEVAYRYLFNWQLGSHVSTCYFGNLTITRDPSQSGNVFSTGTMVEGDNTDGRRMCITNIHYTNLACTALTIESALGVSANCQFDTENNQIPIYGYHRVWNGSTLGNGRWATNDLFGTDQFWFIEDCGLHYTDHNFVYTLLDGYAGWSYVFRYNSVTNGRIEGHGPELSAGRGTRAVENYRNRSYVVGAALSGIYSYVRSGVQVYHDNQINDLLSAEAFHLVYYRMFEDTSGWRNATGTNAWDLNTAGNPVYSGTVLTTNAIDARCFSVTVAGTPFTANQHQGKAFLRTSDLGGNGQNFHSVVLSNSLSTLFLALGQNDQLLVATGDTFDLNAITLCLDQQGAGMGGLASGTTPWALNEQVVSACYEWNNTNSGGTDLRFSVPDTNPTVLTNTHYIGNTMKPGYTEYEYPHPLRQDVLRTVAGTRGKHIIKTIKMRK